MPLERYRYATNEALEQITGPSEQFLSEGYKRIKGFSEYPIIDEIHASPHILYIDGATSSGKTTTIEMLRQEMPSALSIPEFSSRIPQTYKNIGPGAYVIDQLRSQFWFYNQYVEKDQEIKHHTGNIIVDRGLLGLFCYSNLLGKNISSRIMLRAIHHQWASGFYVFLTARPEILRERIIRRKDDGKITTYDWEHGMSSFIQALHNSVEEVAHTSNSLLIDTSDKSPEEVTEEIKKQYDRFYRTVHT